MPLPFKKANDSNSDDGPIRWVKGAEGIRIEAPLAIREQFGGVIHKGQKPVVIPEILYDTVASQQRDANNHYGQQCSRSLLVNFQEHEKQHDAKEPGL